MLRKPTRRNNHNHNHTRSLGVTSYFFLVFLEMLSCCSQCFMTLTHIVIDLAANHDIFLTHAWAYWKHICTPKMTVHDHNLLNGLQIVWSQSSTQPKSDYSNKKINKGQTVTNGHLVTEGSIREINKDVKTQWKLGVLLVKLKISAVVCVDAKKTQTDPHSSKTRVSLYFNVMWPSLIVITLLIVFYVFILLKTLNLNEHLC